MEKKKFTDMGKENLKNTIRVERAKKKITQEELAKEIDVSRQTIHSIENGSNPSIILALKMAKYFECEIKDIFLLETVN